MNAMNTPEPSKPVDARVSLLAQIEECERSLAEARDDRLQLSKRLADVNEYIDKTQQTLRSAAHELIGRLRESTGEPCDDQDAPTIAEYNARGGF